MIYINKNIFWVDRRPLPNNIPLICSNATHDPDGGEKLLLLRYNAGNDTFTRFHIPFKFSGFKQKPGLYWLYDNMIASGECFPCEGKRELTKEELVMVFFYPDDVRLRDDLEFLKNWYPVQTVNRIMELIK